jgi:hypothetical protein
MHKYPSEFKNRKGAQSAGQGYGDTLLPWSKDVKAA